MTTRYLGASGLDVGAQKVVNLADGSANNDAATWGQVQNLLRGAQRLVSVRARATTNVSLTGTQTIDGVALIAGDRVLVDLQTTATEDGVYVVAAGAWARATDVPVGFNANGFAVTVTEGTVNGDKMFLQTSDTAVIGTNGLTFIVLPGAGVTYTADGNGIELSGNQFALELDGSTLVKSAAGVRIGSAAAGAGLIESSGVLAVGAGTGITVAADAIAVDTGVVARWFSNGGTHSAGTSVSLTHGLGRKSYHTDVIIASTGEVVVADVVQGDNSVTVNFGASQAANSILISVVG